MKDRKSLMFLLPFGIILVMILLGHLIDFSEYPSAAADGAAWDKSWEMLAKAVGVEPPGHGLTLQENNTVLAGDDTYYASWTIGDSTPYVNAEGKDAALYPAQLYLLLYGCADATSAQKACDDFLAHARENYAVEAERAETHNTQDYLVLDYTCGSDTNPYARGCSAFAVRGNYVLAAELACTEEFEGDAAQILSDFLDGCHYSADLPQ